MGRQKDGQGNGKRTGKVEQSAERHAQAFVRSGTMGGPSLTAATLEPELEGSAYQAAPITSLALARWSWAVLGLLLGGALGYAVPTDGGYRGTAVVQIRSNGSGPATDQGQMSQAGIAKLAATDDVIERAVGLLRPVGTVATASQPAQPKRAADAKPTPCDQAIIAPGYRKDGGRLPDPDASPDPDGSARGYLAAALAAQPATGSTDLVEVSVLRGVGSPNAPGYEANAIACAVEQKIEADADERIAELKAELTERLATMSPTSAEAVKIRDDYITQVDRIAFVDKQGLAVIPTKQAYWVGGNPRTMALFGAAGGTFLGALLAVAVGAGRRRPRSPRELVALAPDLVVRTTSQAGELAGRLLETGRRAVVVLALPRAGFQAAQLGMAVAHHVRTHGATVAFVDRLSDADRSAAQEERLWALRRDVRRDVHTNFSADVVVVACPADEEALSLIAGQSDLLVVVVAKRRGSGLALIRRTVDAVRVSEPVVVLAS